MSGYIGTRASVVTPGAERKKVFSISTTTTSLTGLEYTPGFVHVFHNGVRLVDGTDYTATNGTSITLTTAAQNGDEVVVISYATFQVADAYTKAESDDRYVNAAGDTMTGALAVNGNLTVDTNTLFVDAANNRVGVGTSSPAQLLHVKGGSGDHYKVRLEDSGNNVGLELGQFGTNGQISSPTAIEFCISQVENARLDTSGNLLVGATSTVAVSGAGSGIELNNAGYINTKRNSTGFVGHMQFVNPNGIVGLIATDGSSTSYNTSSDYRLKEDVQPMVGSVDRLMTLKPVNFAWRADGSRVDGFLAHEAQAVVPECVTGQKDQVQIVEIRDEDGKVTGTEERPVYQGIDQSKIVPLLTAALQEALTKIEQLEARMAILEGGAA
jgi:hypothetical protein